MPSGQVLCCAPVLQVLMVSPDIKRLREAFEEVAPVFERFDDRKHLSIVDLVVAFGFVH